jgi:hypothetical protein
LSGRLRAPAILLATGALALGALAGCGDDDEGIEVTVPEISIEDTTTEAAPTETTETTETTEPETGGTGAPGVDPNQEDSAANDKPPAPGSPEEAFEQACKEDPAACG